MTDFCIVTGAFGYSGRYITQRLLDGGKRVRTLTGHPNRPNPFGDNIEVAPLDFSNRDDLAKSMAGADVLFNTYWIRFDHGEMTFDKAVENSKILIKAAEDAGVRRIVHVEHNKSLGNLISAVLQRQSGSRKSDNSLKTLVRHSQTQRAIWR